MVITKCYLCKSDKFKKVAKKTRDLKKIFPIKCENCNLVTLNTFSHIKKNHYENSGMHNAKSRSIKEWMKQGKVDDLRRANSLKKFIKNKTVLDFGCGSGGFLFHAKKIAKQVTGVELETRVQNYWKNSINIFSDIDSTKQKFDLITMFHVVEHVGDPIKIITNIEKFLKKKGVLIIEVPNHDDALISMYDSKEFIESYYWSQHLYVFNNKTLKNVIKKSGFKSIQINQVQRYTLSNHLHWLAKGLPNGHNKWAFLNDQKMDQIYSERLLDLKKCDTIMAICK